MISVILLAGGKGERMGAPIPKQFLPLQNKPIALYSLEVFLRLEEVAEVIVVCAPEFRHIFEHFPVQFAMPGERRQDSLYNGLQKVSPQSQWICSHDAARPFISSELIKILIQEAKITGSATLAMPAKNTIKQANSVQQIACTLDRALIWEVQTPQLVKKDVLQEGFDHARASALTVTDDVSLAELVGQSVKLVHGHYQNIKITTPEDLLFAEWILLNLNTKCALPTMAPTTMDGKSSPMAAASKASSKKRSQLS